MNYLSIQYYFFLALLVPVYYLLPEKRRWYALFGGSILFYLSAAGSIFSLGVFLLMILLNYDFSLLLDYYRSRILLVLGCAFTALPLIFLRTMEFMQETGLTYEDGMGILLPVGMSFFTLQMLAYLADIYGGRTRAQRHFLKYVLFISFFPQILQGPIPRYGELGGQLFDGNTFKEENIVRGFHRIMWGLFLKFMIADKAGIVVNTVFEEPGLYKGGYVLLAGVLFCLQLYTDFQACVMLAQGAARCFGIVLSDNFRHPFFAVSVRDFWRRWHITLTGWLRDYVYIPLGGNRGGKIRACLCLIPAIAAGVMWHGSDPRYAAIGFLLFAYVVLGEMTARIRRKLCVLAGIPEHSWFLRVLRSMGVFILMLPCFILFRAPSLDTAVYMLGSICTVRNYWIFFDDSLLALGLEWKEWGVLLLSFEILLAVSLLQTRVRISTWILGQHPVVRWTLYFAAILAVLVFGSYGFGMEAPGFLAGKL